MVKKCVNCGHPWYVVIHAMRSSLSCGHPCYTFIMEPSIISGYVVTDRVLTIKTGRLYFRFVVKKCINFHVVIHDQKFFAKNKFLHFVKVLGTEQDGIVHL